MFKAIHKAPIFLRTGRNAHDDDLPLLAAATMTLASTRITKRFPWFEEHLLIHFNASRSAQASRTPECAAHL